MSGTAPAPAAIEVHDLHFSYPDGRPALQGVDLRVATGERVAVLDFGRLLAQGPTGEVLQQPAVRAAWLGEVAG